MSKSSRPSPRLGVATVSPVLAYLVALGTLGCAPDGADSIDMDASKAIAAQKGMGPQAGKPDVAKKPTGQPIPVPAPPTPPK